MIKFLKNLLGSSDQREPVGSLTGSDATESSEVRKRSLSIAKTLGFPLPKTLPLLDEDEEVLQQDLTSIVNRMLCLHCIGATAHTFSRERAQAWLQREGAWDYLTEPERDFLTEGKGDRKLFQMQIEGLYALAWATRLVPTLDVSQGCPTTFVAVMPDLRIDQSAELLRSKAKLRAAEEITATLDTLYVLHWGLIELQLSRSELPAAYSVIERRRALEWLLSDESWEDVPLDT